MAKRNRTNHDLQNITQKTKDWATNPTKNMGELRYSGRISITCSTSSTHQVLSHTSLSYVYFTINPTTVNWCKTTIIFVGVYKCIYSFFLWVSIYIFFLWVSIYSFFCGCLYIVYFVVSIYSFFLWCLYIVFFVVSIYSLFFVGVYI